MSISNKNGPNFFDVLKSVITKSQVQDEFVEKLFDPFICTSWLSADPQTCHSINALNSSRGIGDIPKKAQYKFMKGVVKLPKNSYIPFDKKDKYNVILLNTIMTNFKCGKEVAKEYSKILGTEKILQILNKHALINAHVAKQNSTKNKTVLDIRELIRHFEKQGIQCQ